MSCNCNKPKCDGKCGISPSVLQINNPGDCTLFHRVEVPASMGDSKTNPPKNGDYRNVLLYYVADGTSWFFSSDGIPQKLVNGFTNYEDAINLPQINGETLIGDKSGAELGLQDKLIAGDNIQIAADGKTISATDTTYTAGDNIQISDQNVISATDTTYGPATDDEIGLVKPGDGLSIEADGTLNIDDPAPEDFFDGPATDSDCGTSISLDNMIGGQPVSFELKGNTTQQTYTGKNLFPLIASTTNNGIIYTQNADGTYDISGKSTATANAVVWLDDISAFTNGETYTLSVSPAPTGVSILVEAYNGTTWQRALFVGSASATTITSAIDLSNANRLKFSLRVITTGTTVSLQGLKIQLEKGSTDTSWERYVGGTSSPSPIFPQVIHTVSGVQTVSINGKTYDIDLGDIELCEISSYRDRFYKENGTWKMHKATKKIILDDSYSWYYGNSLFTCQTAFPDMALQEYAEDAPAVVISDQYVGSNWYKIYHGSIDNAISSHDSVPTIRIRTSLIASAADMETWLTTNPMTVYYALSEPTDVVVTAPFLTAQLTAIELESGANSITLTSSGLVGELCVEGYKDNWGGNISNISDEIEELASSNGGEYTPEYLFTRYRQTGTSTAFDATVPREMEGIVYTGNEKAVIFYRPASVTANSEVLVEEIDFTNNTTNPQILRSATINGIGSANSACYDSKRGKIYTWVSDSTFAVIDYDTLQLIDVFTVPNISLASCIAYDSSSDKFYITDGVYVWELDMGTLATTLVFSYSNRNIRNGLQGFDVRKGKFYFAMSNPRAIVMANATGGIEKIISISTYDHVGHYCSYIADISFVDDDNILLTPHCEGDYVEYNRNKSSYYVNYVSLLNVNGNNFQNNRIGGVYESKEIYLDTTSMSDSITYSDGSSAHPLRLVSEYQNNKYKKIYNFRAVTGSTVKYYGTIILFDEDLNFSKAFECEGGSLRGASLSSIESISTLSARLYVTGSTIESPILKLGYNDPNNKNYFTTSSLIVGSITDENGNMSGAVYEIQNSFKLGLNCDVLFSTNNIAGESSVTVGDISSYEKIKVITTDSTSQQFSEEGIVPASGDVYMNFNRITSANTSTCTIKTGRITIARATGVITIDREHSVALAPDPSIAITADSGRIKILRVEGYK